VKAYSVRRTSPLPDEPSHVLGQQNHDHANPIHRVAGGIDGYAEVMAATPEAIETATVMM